MDLRQHGPVGSKSAEKPFLITAFSKFTEFTGIQNVASKTFGPKIVGTVKAC
jgi:hypothetical protein